MHQLDYFTNHKGSGSEPLRALYGEFDMMRFGVKQSLHAFSRGPPCMGLVLEYLSVCII